MILFVARGTVHGDLATAVAAYEKTPVTTLDQAEGWVLPLQDLLQGLSDLLLAVVTGLQLISAVDGPLPPCTCPASLEAGYGGERCHATVPGRLYNCPHAST